MQVSEIQQDSTNTFLTIRSSEVWWNRSLEEVEDSFLLVESVQTEQENWQQSEFSKEPKVQMACGRLDYH